MLTNIIEDRDEDYWDKTQDEIKAELRLSYLKSFIRPQSKYCPECRHELTTTEDETICTHCGLIVSMSIEYVAGQKIDLPYGRH